MNEIQKLRQRLLNVGHAAREYRMTVQEAKALLADIDAELANAAKKVTIIEPPKPDPIAVQHIIMDGGSFDHPSQFSPPEFKLPPGTLV